MSNLIMGDVCDLGHEIGLLRIIIVIVLSDCFILM